MAHGSLIGDRQEFRLAERIAEKTLVPFARLLPVSAQKNLTTSVETLATRMHTAGKAAIPGAYIVKAKDI